MFKRKLRSDTAREKQESHRAILPGSTKDASPGPGDQEKRRYIKKQKVNVIRPNSSQPTPRGTFTALIEGPTVLLDPRPFHLPFLQQITTSSILAVVSKSFSGLRLSQNSITLKQIAPEHRLYASAICRSPLLADKLLAFRTSGPSFSAIRNALVPPKTATSPLEINALFLTRWIIMRLFAFGHPDLITALGNVQIAQDVLDSREAYRKSSGLGVNSLPAYGNIRFNPKRVASYVDRVFVVGHNLFGAIAQAMATKGRVILFHEMMKLIEEAAIPYYSSGTLLQWLLACDLAELEGVVTPPTARDLAVRIECCAKRKKGGSGAWKGLVSGMEEVDWPELTVDNLIQYLEGIYHGVKEGLGKQDALFGDRGFWYSDLEHCLCKVIRAAKY